MVIIRVNANVNHRDLLKFTESIHRQARHGVIVLPHICELLNEVPEDEEIQIIHQDARVAELEAELARAMFYLSAQKDCNTCKHEMGTESPCPADCEWCSGEPCAHICQACQNGSKWEWRGAHGTE